jgi:hypothetical protein
VGKHRMPVGAHFYVLKKSGSATEKHKLISIF